MGKGESNEKEQSKEEGKSERRREKVIFYFLPDRSKQPLSSTGARACPSST